MIVTVAIIDGYLRQPVSWSDLSKACATSCPNSSVVSFVKTKFRAVIPELLVLFTDERKRSRARGRRYEERTSRRFGAKSFLPDELVKARPRVVNPFQGRSDGVAEYSRIRRPTHRTTPGLAHVCARVLHIPYPRRWASLDASVASVAELCKASERSRGYRVQEK